MNRPTLPKNLKELIMVILVGAGLIVALSGAFSTEQVGFVIYSKPDIKLIIIGSVFILAAAIIGFVTKSGKDI